MPHEELATQLAKSLTYLGLRLLLARSIAPRPQLGLCCCLAGRVRTALGFHRFPCLSPSRSATVSGCATFCPALKSSPNAEAGMRSCLANPGRALLLVRIAFLAALTLPLSGWTTCNAMFAFRSCQDSILQPQISSLSPDIISGDAESVLLTVNGSNLAPRLQIMWNGSGLPTTFIDSHHLQTMVTQQTFASFGGSAGSNVEISVGSPELVAGSACPNSRNSATLVLVIN